jgi:hypothetical protein
LYILGVATLLRAFKNQLDLAFAERQAPYLFAAAHLVIYYPGSKLGQADDALNQIQPNTNWIAIGYSAGGDAALMFADMNLNRSSKPLVGQ